MWLLCLLFFFDIAMALEVRLSSSKKFHLLKELYFSLKNEGFEDEFFSLQGHLHLANLMIEGPKEVADGSIWFLCQLLKAKVGNLYKRTKT